MCELLYSTDDFLIAAALEALENISKRTFISKKKKKKKEEERKKKEKRRKKKKDMENHNFSLTMCVATTNVT